MFTSILIGFSIILQITALYLNISLIKNSKSRLSWILMGFAFFLIIVKRGYDLFFFLQENSISQHITLFLTLDIAVSILIITGLAGIKKLLGGLRISEKELIASETRFKALFNNSNDEIFLADFEGNFLEVNNEACIRLGYSREEFLKMNFTDIKTPKYINLVKQNIETILKNGTHIYETEHISKEKKIIYLEMNSRVVNYEGKNAILTIARDITERRVFERKVLSAIIETEERERKRFAKEMHDGLGPLLSTIKLYVNEMCSDEIEKSEQKQFVTHTNELIDDAISNIRTISDNLMPRLIDDYGLVKAIDSICKKINITGKIKIDFQSQNYIQKLDPKIELVFFRITEELINNTIKHAAAQNIQLSITVENNKLLLNFSDDGKGFSIDEIFNNAKAGMGLKNIISRVKSINANYNFGTNKTGVGFNFTTEAEIINAL